MNVENLRALSTALRAGTYKDHVPDFNMNYMILNQNDPDVRGLGNINHGCGTCACIAGLACIMFDQEHVHRDGDVVAWFGGDQAEGRDVHLLSTAEEALGLGHLQATQLFYPDIGTFAWHRITPDEAADVIDNLIATGKVDWSAVDERLGNEDE